MARKIIVDVSDSYVHNAQSRDEVEWLESMFFDLEDLGFEITDEDDLDFEDEDAPDNYEPFPYRAEATYDPALLIKVKRIVASYQRDTDEHIYVRSGKRAEASRVTPSVEAARRSKKK